MADHQSADGLLGPLKYEVMRALWEDSPSNVSGVLARVNETRPAGQRIAYTTAMTVLSRLHDKGILARRKRGRGYSYEPRFDETALIERLSQQEVERLVDRFGPVALAQFAAAIEDADPTLLSRLRDQADDDD
jgi:predicted transcriptional regulator